MSRLLCVPCVLHRVPVRNVWSKASQQGRWCTQERVHQVAGWVGCAERCLYASGFQANNGLRNVCVSCVVERSSDRAINKDAVALSMTTELYKYVLDHNAEPEVMGELRNETAKMRGSQMQVSPEQARFMSWLVETLQPKRALEVGVYTGYSSLAVAMALPENGVLYAIDQNEESMEVARKYWEKAKIAHKIRERIGSGVPMLERLLEEEGEGSIDFAFIDANKRAYDQYYELSLKLLRKGGIVGLDNTLWYGNVADPEENSAITRAIREINDKVACDPRVSSTMLQIGDGFTLARKL